MIPTQSIHPNASKSSIYPYYKPDNIFERDQAYYQQLQRNTRRTQNQPSLANTQSNQWNQYQQVQTQIHSHIGQAQYNNPGYQNGVYSTVQQVPINSQMNLNQSFGQTHQHNSPFFSRVEESGGSRGPYNISFGHTQAQNLGYHVPNMIHQNAQMSSPVNQQNYLTESEQNKKLKQRLDDLINFKDQYDDGSQVKKKHHYNKDSNEGRTIQAQQNQIHMLLDQVKRNNMDIGKYKNAIVQLQKSMNNIQSVDREIYKQLKNLSNRDQELLDRATAALARGATRQQIGEILNRIIS